MAVVYVIMGVSGCGKSTVGETLAQRLECAFYDGDDLHPPENVAKMASGKPLDDTDRYPWLARLRNLIAAHLEKGETAVLACSALKKKYRDQLREGNDGIQFVYLKGDFELIWGRMQARAEHYMKADMLHSQFADLEEPDADKALIVGIENDVDTIVEKVFGDGD
jgi:gluconokinase